MVKIGLIGFFNTGAFSDDIIEYTTKSLLSRYMDNIVFDNNVLWNCGNGTKPEYLNSFDLIVHCGGSLLGKCTHPPLRDINLWIDKVSTPIVVFGTGYRYEKDKEPLKPEMRERMNLLFKKAEVVSLRGERSVAHCKENSIDVSKVCSLGDPAIACDMAPVKYPICIGGNVRDPQPEEVQHVPKQVTQKLMAQIYDWLIDFYNAPLVLTSFRHNYGFDNDVEGAEQTISLMKHADKASIFEPQNFQEAFNAVCRAKFWFGQRLHPSIFASIQDIPFVGLEYQFEKTLDWMTTVKSENYVWSNQTLDEFIEKFDDVAKEMEVIRVNTVKVRKDICETAQKIMRLIGGG